MIGRKLAHYEIVELLGKGGMGEVYLARDTRLNREVALKILPAEMTDHPQRLQRFEREAQTVAALNHPNIVTLHSVEDDEGTRFITMELVEGRPLQEIISPGGLPSARVFEIGLAVAEALVAAHAKSVIHRDLKPSNIMITPEGRVKLLDFGLAKLNGPADEDSGDQLDTLSVTRAGVILGTPYYMAPEQARGGLVDERADIFSLGVILYEMATGERPFQGDSTIELLSAVLRDRPRPVIEIRPDLSPLIETVIGRCLAKDPKDRYQSTADLAADLRALKDGSRLQTLDLPAHEIFTDAASSRPGWAASRRWVFPSVAVLALAAVVAVVVTIRSKTPVALDPHAKGGRVVAVMPFENLGAEDDAYFADGITDEITSRLALIEGLEVISRTSARTYVGSGKPTREIGKELGTDYILEGTIRWDRSEGHGRVLVSPRLVKVANDTYVWSDQFEREVTEIFSLQAEIASRIAESLDVTLVAATRQNLSRQPTANINAYQAYLQGMQQLYSPGFGRESFELGLQMFERAVVLDPGFALAHARLSSMNSRMYHYGYDRTPERLQTAKSAADRALALQPDLPEAHLALGHYYYWGTRQYELALNALEDAHRLAPNNDEALLATAYVKRRQGDFDAAIDLFERCRILSPRDPNVFVALGETYSSLRRFAEAEAYLNEAVALQPGDAYPYTELALVHLRKSGDTAAASAILAEAPPASNSEFCRVGYLVELFERDYPGALDLLAACPLSILEAGAFYTPIELAAGLTHRLAGEQELAREAFQASRMHLETRLRKDPEDPRLHGALGLAYAGIGEDEDAVRHGRRAVELYPLAQDALEGPVHTINLAMILAMVGQHAEALEQLDAVLSVPSILSSAWLEADPRWDDLRGEPGFGALLAEHRADASY